MKERLIPIALAALFLGLGPFVLDLPGLQADEALFSSVLYSPKVPPVTVRLVFGSVPAMCFPYIGTLKTGIFTLYSRVFEPSAASVHFLSLAIGALSIYLFTRILQLLRQPLLAGVLLATDATYLMTIRSDWGPVALQHLCAMAGVYAAVRYSQTEKIRWAAAGGFIFGLGFWDKITFLWILFALVAGAVFTARKLFKPKAIAVAAVFFLLGCYPLLVYNWKTGGNSFKGRGSFDLSGIQYKADVLWGALGNFNIFGAGTEHALPPIEPVTAIASISSKLDFTFPLLPWLFLAGILSARWQWRSSYYQFYLIAMIAGYGYMLSLKDAGGVHHVVLLWPLPHLLAATVPLRRWMVAGLLIANLFQINHFYAQFLRREVSVEWSDATVRLAARLKGDPGTYRIVDWGIYYSLHLLLQGGTDLYLGRGPNGRYISRPRELSFEHVDLNLIPEETITDSAGRPVYIISRRAPIEGK